jgi:glycosyltransferase involved in cell wall biosynthesis
VLAYRRAAAEALIRNGENGMTVRPDDAEAFTDAALALAGDAALRQRLGHAAVESMGEHGWDGIVERFATVLRETT